VLAITLKNGERVRLRDAAGRDTWVMVIRSTDGKVRIGIDAPPDIDIAREELLARSGTRPGEGSTPHEAGTATEGP
jgi:sRNA-binding carbon storage regulator CsrA